MCGEVGEEVHHPLFARVFALLGRSEARLTYEYRRELLTGVRCEVVEVGAGTGINFAYYPPQVSRLVAVEPEPYLRERAERAAQEAQIPVEVVAARAERLPFADGVFDVAVVSLMLCSAADPNRALSEIRRVLKPRGELRFWEHVRADEPRLARMQRLLDHVWPRVGGGCHLTRDTAAAIEAGGFEIVQLRRFRFQPCLLAAPSSPQILGLARTPGGR